MYLSVRYFGSIYYAPSAVLSAKNTAANNLSPRGANVTWGIQTDKSPMTQKERCATGKEHGTGNAQLGPGQ